jgi:hypothetical protein
MKTKFFKNASIACVTMILFAGTFSACKPNEPTATADQTKLTALVDSCTTLLAGTTVSTDYPAAAITAFQTTLTTAKTAAADKTISQTAVDNLVVQLRAAQTTFLAAAYGAIPKAALLMGMTFDETVASNQFKTEGKGWTAVLKTGPSQIFTTTNLPSFVTGKIGKAIYFSKGSHLEISDYTANDLLGKELSISVWVKLDSTKGGNYVISYNYWKTWKLQIQEQNKPYFTVATVSTAGIVDADNQLVNSVINNTWTHVVISMSLTTGKLSFYINGVNTMEWTKSTQEGLTGTVKPYTTILPLIIGGCTTYAEAVAAFDWTGWNTPATWDGFVGSMDELKVYNVALTDGQVAKLYKDENK